MPKNKTSVGSYTLITMAFIVYSSTGIFTKLASKQEFFSLRYIASFMCVILMLGFYAVLWQKILIFMPLNKAFLFKSVSILITLLYSFFLFSEVITVNNLIGSIVIISGLIVLSWKG